MKSELVPRIRFGEFEEPWEQHTLGQYFEFKNGINADKEQYGSGIKFINVSDILNNSYLTHDVIEGSVDVAEDQIAKYEVKYGDILFQRSSETRLEVGSANVYLDKLNRAVFGGFVIRGQAKRPYDPEFMNYLLKTSSARKDITSRSGGSTRYNIGQESIAASSVHLPTLPEQQKIAAFLTAVDGRLAGLRRQVASLEQYKLGVMQGVFGDEVGGEWIDVKVGKAYSFFSTNSLSRAKLNYETGECKNIHYGDIHTQFSQYLDVRQATVPYITPGIAMKGAAYKHSVQVGDVLLADASEDINDIGKATEVVDAGDIPLYAGLHTIHARPKPGTIAPGFGTLLFQSPAFRRQVSKIAQGAKVLGISPNSIKAIQLRIPPLPEQRRIATFLRALDARIGLVERQLAGAEAFKRGLLQGMFV